MQLSWKQTDYVMGRWGNPQQPNQQRTLNKLPLSSDAEILLLSTN